MRAGSAMRTGTEWRDMVPAALDEALEQLDGAPVDLALIFASSAWAKDFPEMLAKVSEWTSARVITGCSGQSIIGGQVEAEGETAFSVLLLNLPQASVRMVWLSQADVAPLELPVDWRRAIGIHEDEVNAWIVFADPFHIDSERLVASISSAYPDRPMIGGMASASSQSRLTYVFADGQVHDDGAVLIALGGDVTVKAVVAQGCQPIGEPWIITRAEDNHIYEIAGRPAIDVLLETFRKLSPELQIRARGNLLVGLVIDEYRSELRRGDFLIRNLLGIDQAAGSIAIGAQARVGQTIQFQLRDAEAAEDDFRLSLEQAKLDLGANQPAAALLCSCTGRGRDLFGAANRDAESVARNLAPLPLAGFFCNGEIGPVGNKNFLHGFTASLGLIVQREKTAE